MEDLNEIYRTLGEHGAQITALREGQASANAKLDILLQRSEQDKGARGILWKVGGAAGTGGGLLVAVASWWVNTFGPRGGTP